MTERPTRALLKVLRRRWPQCFAWQNPGYRPLKIGIHEEILAAADLGLTQAEVCRVLANLTHKICYLRRFEVGAARIDLDGHPAGVITEKDVRWAQERLRWRQRQARAKAHAAAVAAKAAKAAAPPPRLSLAGLKAAAMARRAAAC
jgi:ProP effector